MGINLVQVKHCLRRGPSFPVVPLEGPRKCSRTPVHGPLTMLTLRTECVSEEVLPVSVSPVCFHFWISWPSVAFGQTGRCFGQFLKVFKSRLMCSFFCMDGISYFVRREEFLW